MALEFALNRPSGEDNSYGDSPGKGDFSGSRGFLSLKIPCNQECPFAHTGGSPMGSQDSLNWSHKLHLSTSFKYVDDLLSDIESILVSSTSKSPFPKYRDELLPVQVKVIQDYLARIRAQMVHVLKSQGIEPPEPRFIAARSVRVNLEFADIAFDECRPYALRGYGELPESIIPELNGLVEEMRSLVRKLGMYLSQDTAQDPEARLQRLESTGDEIELLRRLERIINQHGMVEFRAALSTILDKIESNNFQIALFGRVSSGKSSLLNHILGTEVLPVGVNPITAVPTRIIHGAEPALTVAYPDRNPERVEVTRLAEFASEQFNPGNAKHVTRIVLELPSERLRDGVVFVDTPGLGSLATVGSAETLAYLPQCDLGVVLVDAGSTLSQEDLSTIQSLNEAAIPAFVLLSKADLLGREDRSNSVNYIAAQITSQLGLTLSVFPVSTRAEHARLLEEWFENEIAPLCEKHQEMAQQSVRRKIGALREAVEAALKVRTAAAAKSSKDEKQHLDEAETQLRKATGNFEGVDAFCRRASDEIRLLGRIGLSRAADEIAHVWLGKGGEDCAVGSIVNQNVVRIAVEGANQIHGKIQALSQDLSRALAGAAVALRVTVPRQEDLASVIREMPRLDPGPLEFAIHRDFLTLLGKAFTKRRIEKKLRRQIGPAVDEAFHRYGRLMESWSRRTLAELHRQFDAHADGYRAQIQRLTGGSDTGREESEKIRRDLESLSHLPSAQPVPSAGGPN